MAFGVDIEHEPWKASEYGNLALVRAVKQRPCLYNNTIPEYSMKEVTRAAWQEIADEFGCPVEKLKERWKRLRVGFLRNRKKQLCGPKPTKPFYLDEEMSFVLPFLHRLKSLMRCRKRHIVPNVATSESVDVGQAESVDAANESEGMDADEVEGADASEARVESGAMKDLSAILLELNKGENGDLSGFIVESENGGRSHVEIMTEEEFRKTMGQNGNHFLQLIQPTTANAANDSNSLKETGNSSFHISDVLNSSMSPEKMMNRLIQISNAPNSSTSPDKEVRSSFEMPDTADSSTSPEKVIGNSCRMPDAGNHPSVSVKDISSSANHSKDSKSAQSSCVSLTDNPRLQFMVSLLPELYELTEPEFRLFKRKALGIIDQIRCPQR